jgi:hypothetical protein
VRDGISGLVGIAAVMSSRSMMFGAHVHLLDSFMLARFS